MFWRTTKSWEVVLICIACSPKVLLINMFENLQPDDNMWDDGNSLGPKEVHNYLKRVMYNRRNKFNPLWNSVVLGGVKNGQKYLGTVSFRCVFCLYA